MNTAINITSLVDVTMMLLIIFILVAPILNLGIDLKLPEASTADPEPEAHASTREDVEGSHLLGDVDRVVHRVHQDREGDAQALGRGGGGGQRDHHLRVRNGDVLAGC